MPNQSFIADKDLGYAQIAAGGADTAVLISSLTFNGRVGLPPGTETILITPEAQAIRWRSDGTAPTAAVGYPLAVGAELRYTMAQSPQLRVIAQVAGAIVNVYALGRAGSAS